MEAGWLWEGETEGGIGALAVGFAIAGSVWVAVGVGGTDGLVTSLVPSVSRRRFTPLDELSFKPSAVALINI